MNIIINSIDIILIIIMNKQPVFICGKLRRMQRFRTKLCLLYSYFYFSIHHSTVPQAFIIFIIQLSLLGSYFDGFSYNFTWLYGCHRNLNHNDCSQRCSFHLLCCYGDTCSVRRRSSTDNNRRWPNLNCHRISYEWLLDPRTWSFTRKTEK